MKARLLNFILLVSLSANLYSQDNYIDYQRGITKAENLFLDYMYKESIEQFRLVLDNYSFNFPRDCIIAAQISAYIGEDSSLHYFLKKAVRFGVHIDYINSVRLYSKYYLYPWWEDFTKREYYSLRNEYIKGINWEYKALCDKYRKIDSKLRNEDQKWYKNEYIVLRWDIRNKWIKANEKYIIMVDSLIDLYGFPSYKIIGVEDSITLPVSKNKSVGCSQFNIIYNHYSSKKMREDKFQKHLDKLLDEVKKGNLSARDYARIMEIDYRNMKKYKRNTSLYYVFYEPSLTPDEFYPNEEEINRRREDIGLSNCYYERKRKRAALMEGIFQFWYFDF